MAGNPLTDPRLPADLADRVEFVVATVRERATTPVVHAARAVVYGLLAAFRGMAALVLFLISITRGLQSFLDIFLSWARAVYLSYLIIGGILSLVGVLLMRRRRPSDL